jgi:hypothetical protein
METVERMMALLQAVKQSGLTFVEFVRAKEEHIAEQQAELDEVKRLAEFSDKFAVTTPTGRRKRRDAGKPRNRSKPADVAETDGLTATGDSLEIVQNPAEA